MGMIAALYADHSLWIETIQGGLGKTGRTMIHSGFALYGGVYKSVWIPIFACVLTLWFRHYIGKQLRRRLEARPEVFEGGGGTRNSGSYKLTKSMLRDEGVYAV